MQTLSHANTFFLISSVGFGLFIIILALLGMYLVRIFRSVANIARRVERDIDTIGDTAKDLVLDLQHGSLFSLLFRKRKKYTKRELSD